MVFVHSQDSITWDRVNDAARMVKSIGAVVDIDPENVAAVRTIFQRRIRSEMILEWIDNTFDEAALATLKLQDELYNWKALNGRMMEVGLTKLKPILEDIQAAKVVDADVYCQQIQNARPEKNGHDVKKAMEDIMRCLC